MESNHPRPVVTRPATGADVEFMWQVQLRALGPYVTEQFGTTTDQQRDFFDLHFEIDKYRIVESEGERIGFLFSELRSAGLYLGNIALLPDYQNRGLGGRLVSGVIAEADSQGVTVSLQVLKSNPRARRFYEELGFAAAGETSSHVLMTNGKAGDTRST